MRNRAGATLIEVLVAIFVMALGMLALLTLFPLGALSMARAIQDDRAGACAANAAAIAQMKNLRHDPVVLFGPTKTGPDVFAEDLDGPGAGFLPPDPEGPSNPVFVDAAGRRMSFGLPAADWIAGVPGFLPRRTTSYDNSVTDTNRWFGFLDEYEFDRTFGVPSFPATRDVQYSWSYVLRRPRTAETSVVDLTVLVYRRRSWALTATTSLPEYVYTTSGAIQQLFDTTRNVVTIDYNATLEPPPIRAGDWIMDASVAQTAKHRHTHANFYRVVSVTEVPGNKVECELQTPLRDFAPPFTPIAGAPGIYTGTVVILDGLVEVFERGTGWK